MKLAWKRGVFTVPPAQLDIRLSSVAAQLSATSDEAKAVLRSAPQLATRRPEMVGLHVTQLLDLGFSHAQVKSMCLGQPAMLALSYKSQLQADKWAFLTCIMQLNQTAIAACPRLLTSSLPNRLGPRWEYLQQLRLHRGLTFTAVCKITGSLTTMTDTEFRGAYTRTQLRVYDEHFQKEWQRRWDCLLVDQQLSIQDIADNPDLLRILL